MGQDTFREHMDYFRFDEALQMLQADSSLSEVDCFGRTPLNIAVTNGHRGFVKAWIELGLEVNALGAGGNAFGTPLRQAVMCGHYTIAEMLLVAGADPSDAGGRPCVCALIAGHDPLKFIRLLLEHGADANENYPNEITKEDLTLSEWAARLGHDDVVEFLESAVPS